MARVQPTLKEGKEMKWLDFDEYKWRNLFREVMSQCSTENEMDIIQLKLERTLQAIMEERMEEIEGEY